MLLSTAKLPVNLAGDAEHDAVHHDIMFVELHLEFTVVTMIVQTLVWIQLQDPISKIPELFQVIFESRKRIDRFLGPLNVIFIVV